MTKSAHAVPYSDVNITFGVVSIMSSTRADFVKSVISVDI